MVPFDSGLAAHPAAVPHCLCCTVHEHRNDSAQQVTCGTTSQKLLSSFEQSRRKALSTTVICGCNTPAGVYPVCIELGYPTGIPGWVLPIGQVESNRIPGGYFGQTITRIHTPPNIYFNPDLNLFHGARWFGYSSIEQAVLKYWDNFSFEGETPRIFLQKGFILFLLRNVKRATLALPGRTCSSSSIERHSRDSRLSIQEAREHCMPRRR